MADCDRLGTLCRGQARRGLEGHECPAADAEDKTEKAPITPGSIVPARELYGQMLLERGLGKEALAAFEATLKKEPHRFGATIGAAWAAHKAGDLEKARAHYEAAIELSRDAEPVRPAVAEARKFVTSAR
jgi:tetratricopeptide (TPR) repeat protein